MAVYGGQNADGHADGHSTHAATCGDSYKLGVLAAQGTSRHLMPPAAHDPQSSGRDCREPASAQSTGPSARASSCTATSGKLKTPEPARKAPHRIRRRMKVPSPRATIPPSRPVILAVVKISVRP